MAILRKILFIAVLVLGVALILSYYSFELDRIASIQEAIAKSEAELARKQEMHQEAKKQSKLLQKRW